MKPLSDLTVSEALTTRLRELQVFELFAFATRPDEVHVSARWFDRAGVVCTTRGTAKHLADALFQLFAAIESAFDLAAPPPRPPLVRRTEYRFASDRAAFDPEQHRRRGSAEHRRRVALEIAERRGAVTATLLYHSIGGGGAIASGNGAREAREYIAVCESTLAELAAEGLLRRGLHAYEPARTEDS